jgi:hypothetical protein
VARDRLIWGALAALNAALLAHYAIVGRWLYDTQGKVILHDFATIWAAARRSMEGQALAAYDWQLHKQYIEQLFGTAPYLPFFYPPHALLFVAPFSQLPYVPAALAFLALSFVMYAAALRLVTQDGVLAALMAASGGGALYTIWWGQMGFLTAALLVAGLAVMKRAPLWAGVLFGCLTFKPQLGIAIAVSMLAGGQWRIILYAFATALILALAAELIFGPGVWTAFLDSSSESSNWLWSGRIWVKMQSVFALLFPITGPTTAIIVQLLVALLAITVVIGVWRSSADHETRAAASIAATLLTTPYLFPYDTVMLTGAAAFLLRKPTKRYEKMAIVVACLLPMFWQVLFSAATPLAALLLLYLCVRRANRTDVLSNSETAQHQRLGATK